MADVIRIRWAGGERTFSPGTVVQIGRGSTNDIDLVNDNVSRRHAELVHTGTGWMLRDLGSAQGTWVGGVRSPSVPIGSRSSVSLGLPPKGEVLELVVEGAGGPVGADLAGTVVPAAPPPPQGALPPPPAGGLRQPPTPTGPPAPPSPGPATGVGTVIVGDSPDRPGGRLRDSAVAGATVVTGDSLNLECAGSSYTFQPGRTVTIGRDDSCDVVTANPTVSRRHATLRHDGSGWLLEDGGSAGGTFVDGRRITQLRLSGSTAAWLGPVDTGERIVAVTSGETRKPKAARGGGRGVLVGLGIVVLALLTVGGVMLLAGGDDGPDNEALARATVFISWRASATGDQEICTFTITGSGSIIDKEQGLILTNAHVVKPTAEGLDMGPVEIARCEAPVVLPDPDTVTVEITPGLDDPSEPAYTAEVVAYDGTLDLAVIQLTETIGGRIVGPGDFDELTEVAIGNSDDMRTGSAISVFGFPSAAQSDAVTLTTGVISGIVGDPELGTNRAYFNVDARISGGNSGGMAADDSGELIGIPTILRQQSVGSIRPVNLALPLIDAARSGEEYEPQY